MKRRHSIDSSEYYIKHAKRQPILPSILMLNDQCLLELYKYLGLDDFICLSETCTRLKDLAQYFNKIFSEFRINVNMDNKRNDYMEFVISNLSSTNERIAEISIDYHHSKIPMNVKNMSKTCSSVKDLQIANWRVNVTESEGHHFDNVETLTMIDCDFFSGDAFFNVFKKLKVVNFCRFAYVSSKCLRKLFRKNSAIESFVWMGDMTAFDELELFGLLPKLAALSLKVDKEINSCYVLTTQFSNLTKLQLFCNGENISEFLHKLAKATKYPTLKELELLRVKVDELFFYALYYFQQLELLVISTWNYWILKPPLDWPQKLKHLRLSSFRLTKNGLISTIKQLEYIENFDAELCRIVDEDRHLFRNVEDLSDVISAALGDNRKKVDFLLYYCCQDKAAVKLQRYVIDKERLRICHNAHCNRSPMDQLGVHISFPGIEKNLYL